jgi:hypothetical protein
MGQLGFFDAEKRLAALSAKGDPLEAIDRLVPWESLRADIEAVVLTPDEMRKSSACSSERLLRACRTSTRNITIMGPHFSRVGSQIASFASDRRPSTNAAIMLALSVAIDLATAVV